MQHAAHAPFTQVGGHAGIRRAPCGLQPNRSVKRSDGYTISCDPRRSARSRFMLRRVCRLLCASTRPHTTRPVRHGAVSSRGKFQRFKHSHTHSRVVQCVHAHVAVRARQKAARGPRRACGTRSETSDQACTMYIVCQARSLASPHCPIRWVGGMAEISRMLAAAGGDATFVHSPSRSPMQEP